MNATLTGLWHEIVKDLDNDDLRDVFADAIEREDPEWAGYIREGLTFTRARRRRLEAPKPIDNLDLQRRIVATLIPSFAGKAAAFYRGFPDGIHIDNLGDLEQLDESLSFSTIRWLAFGRTGKPQSLEPLLNSRLVRRLDTVSARCPVNHSEFCALAELSGAEFLAFDFEGNTDFETDVYERVALGAACQKLLKFIPAVFRIAARWEPLPEPEPEGTRHWFDERGKALEKKFGYLPWLHDDNMINVDERDLRWYLSTGARPLIPRGTWPPQDSWYFEEYATYQRTH